MVFIASDKQVYRRNLGLVYSYSGQFFKLVNCKFPIREPGWETLEQEERKYTPKGEAGNDGKLDRNISRARQAVHELAFCNPWEYFCTLTFSQEKVKDRYNLDACMKSFCKWLNNYNNRHASASVRYLLIPERHEDGAWHLHGFFMGIPSADLHEFSLLEHLPYSIRSELEKGNQVFSWMPYGDKFGFCTFEPIRTQEGAAKYVTKYITKDLKRSVEEMNAHLYYCSRGLKRKEIVYRDELRNEFVPDFENEYVRIKTADNLEVLLSCFFDEMPKDFCAIQE